MDKDYIYEGMKLFNAQGREIIVDKIEWKNENKDKGYIEGYYVEELNDCNKQVKNFAIDSIGTFLFYQLQDIGLANKVEVIQNYDNYKKYSKKVRDYIKNEQEEKEKQRGKAQEELKKKQEIAEKEKRIREEKEKLLQRKNEEKHQNLIGRINEINDLYSKLESNYGFEGFIHTTDFSNFINIMKSGYIYSRYKAISERLINIDSANEDIIKGTDGFVQNHVRFYFRSKTPTHYNNEGIRLGSPEHHMPIPVMLVAGKDLCIYNNVLFTDGNAKSYITRKTKNVEEIYNFNCSQIFEEGAYNSLDYDERKEITRQRNAELLVQNQVSIRYINKIIFRSKADLKMANILFGDDPRFIVDESKFFNEHQYCKDYIIELKDNILSFGFKMNKGNEHYIRQFRHILRCEFSMGTADYDVLKERVVLKSENNSFYILGTIVMDNNKEVEKIEYLIDGHVSAIWRREND